MDQTLFHFINQQWTNPALDFFMAAISDLEIWKPLLIIIVLIGLFFGGFKARAGIFCLLLSLLVAQQSARFLKSAIQRDRPRYVQSVRVVDMQKAEPRFMTLFKKPIVRYSNQSDRIRPGTSFPSGHMTNNTAIAVCLTLFYRRRGWLYWILTAAIGYSRIYLGDHWPSDVLATLFLAAGETLIVIGLLELLWRWGAAKWAPNVYERHPSLVGNVGQVSNLPFDSSRVGDSRHFP
jgi:undecaprenyl-diphosphatase